MHADIDSTIAALADPARRAIVEQLRKGPQRPSHVADALSLSRSVLSRHLRVLRVAGLINEELLASDARARLVQLRREPFADLRDWITEVEAFWQDQLAAFKQHAETSHKRPRK